MGFIYGKFHRFSHQDLLDLLDCVGSNLQELRLDGFPEGGRDRDIGQKRKASASAQASKASEISRQNRGIAEAGTETIDLVVKACPNLRLLSFDDAVVSTELFQHLENTKLRKWRFRCSSAVRSVPCISFLSVYEADYT